MEAKKCVSCGVEVLEGYTRFKCPSCGKQELVRCRKCRKSSSNYICSNCNFKGP